MRCAGKPKPRWTGELLFGCGFYKYAAPLGLRTMCGREEGCRVRAITIEHLGLRISLVLQQTIGLWTNKFLYSETA